MRIIIKKEQYSTKKIKNRIKKKKEQYSTKKIKNRNKKITLSFQHQKYSYNYNPHFSLVQ